MSERKFIVWEVWAVLNGRETLAVTLPYRQQNVATSWATHLPRGYVMRGTADREPEPCNALSLVVAGESVQLVKELQPREPQPEPQREPTALETPVRETKVRAFGRRKWHTFSTG